MKKLLLLASIFLIGCGSRHIETEKVVVKSAETSIVNLVDSSKTNTKTDESTIVVDNSLIDNIIIEPRDTTKPITIDGHTYRNVIIKHKRSKNNITTTKSINVLKTEQKAVNLKVENIKKVNVTQNKKEIVKSSSYCWLLWFLLLIPIYLLWEKYKDKIWFI